MPTQIIARLEWLKLRFGVDVSYGLNMRLSCTGVKYISPLYCVGE